MSNKLCPKCGGKRCNDIDNKEKYGRCLRCLSKWWIIK